MKFYVSAKEIKRVVAVTKSAGKTTAPADTIVGRRVSNRTVVALGIVLLLGFVRVAVLVVESSAACSTFGKFLTPFQFSLVILNYICIFFTVNRFVIVGQVKYV